MDLGRCRRAADGGRVPDRQNLQLVEASASLTRSWHADQYLTHPQPHLSAGATAVAREFALRVAVPVHNCAGSDAASSNTIATDDNQRQG